MNTITVQIEAEINPTENPDKVKLAVENTFGTVEFQVQTAERGGTLIGYAKDRDGLSKLYNLLRRERIRDAARSIMYKGLDGNTITFYLNKQVAYAGHLSFSEPVGESPLGPIEVVITCDNPRELIDWLTSRTT